MSTIRHLCSHISPCTSCSTTFLLCSSPTHLFVFIIVNYVTWSRSSFQVLSSHSSLMEKYITVKLQYGTIWGSSSAIFQPNYLRMGKAVLGGPCLRLLIRCMVILTILGTLPGGSTTEQSFINSVLPASTFLGWSPVLASVNTWTIHKNNSI